MIPGTSISRTAAVLLIVVATFVIHGHVLDRFWLDDDPQVLLHATRYGPLEVVVDRDVWQELSASNYTPLVTISFDVDLALFGLDPEPFYAHQLLSVALCAIALRLLLIAFGLDRRLALLAAMIFLVAPPTMHVAGHLMTRHYVEGLLFALLSILFWKQSLADDAVRVWWLIGSVGAYLGSILAKEVFLLLPLVVVALGIGRTPLRRLALLTAPYGVSLLLYLFWRSWMLGGGGGYGTTDIASHLISTAGAWGERNVMVALWFLLLAGVAALTWGTSRIGVARAVLIFVAAVAPLAGVGDALEPRHLLVPAVAVICGAVGGISRVVRPRARSLAIAVVAVVSLVVAIPGWLGALDDAARMEAEGRYVWEEGNDAATLLATSPGWYLEGVADLDRIWRDETSPRVLYSRTGLGMIGEDGRYLTFEESGSPRSMPLSDIDREPGYVATAPIELTITRKNRTLLWRFGPECDCEWIFYSYPDYQRFVVPREGRRVVPRPRERQWFRVQRLEAGGEWTISPPLELPDNGESIRWKRRADRPNQKR